jgi:hypothetical protein
VSNREAMAGFGIVTGCCVGDYFNRRAFSRPFTAFRLAHSRGLDGNTAVGQLRAWVAVLNEERNVQEASCSVDSRVMP